MKTVLLALVLIGATLALLAVTRREGGDGVLPEPRQRPDSMNQWAPPAELVPPVHLESPAVVPSGLVPTTDQAPWQAREAVAEQPASADDLDWQSLGTTDAADRFENQILNLWESRTGVQFRGKYVVSGQILAGETIVFTSSPEERPDGTWIENYDEGKPKVQGQIRNGREVGLWIYWHENGERSAEGRYVNGERHGLWTSWHADGSKESEGIYSYGEREGSWIDFHPGGTRLLVATYLNGELEGRFVRWHSNGIRESEGFCVAGDLDGPWREWYPTGTTSSHGDYRYGIRVGRWTYLDADGELNPSRSGRYENGEKVAD